MAGEERRLHPEVSTLSAATGRFTMSSPSLQNVPKLAREFILPEPGMALVSGDFSAVEVRIGAAYARESGLISDLRAGLDPYALIAESTWGPEFTPDDRDACKPILLGRMYGRSATSLARQQLSRNPHADFETLKKQAEEIMQNGIDARYPALRRASANLSTMVRVGMSRHRLPSGRCVTVEPAAAHKIFNAVVQGTGRELLIEAGFRLMDAELGTLWLSVHDEWVLMVPAAEAEATAARMKEVMATEFLGVPIVASTKVLGTKWGK
jgi:DNA polymerase-1